MNKMICDICEEEFEGSELNEGQDFDGQFTCVCDDCDSIPSDYSERMSERKQMGFSNF